MAGDAAPEVPAFAEAGGNEIDGEVAEADTQPRGERLLVGDDGVPADAGEPHDETVDDLQREQEQG